MAIADATQKNIVENTAAAGDELEQLNTKTDQVKELQENLLAESEKGNKILAKSFGLDEDEIRRQKEKDAKARRASDGGGSLGPSPGGKGKGIFGLLGSMFKVLGGGFLKILGPIWKVLKIMFKGLGFIAVGAALLAGLAFFQKDAKGQEEMINNVIDFFKGVGEALKKFGSIFSGSFMEGMDDKVVDGVKKEGLGTKFKKFGEAWGKVTKQISEISIGEYKGLDGVAKFMGDMFSKIAGWFLDLGTGIATLITDPRLVWAKLKVSISNFFGGIGDTLGRFADKFLNMEFLLSMLPDWMQTMAREAGFVEDASKKRATEKLGEMNKLAEREKLLKQREIDMEKKYQDQKARVAELDSMLEGDLAKDERARIEKERDLAKDREIAAIDLKLEATAERERNIDRFKHAKETYEASMESVIKEKAAAIVKQKAGIDMIQVEKDIAEIQEERRELINDKLDQDYGNLMEATLHQAEKFKEMIGGKSTITAGDLTEDLKQNLLVEFGSLGLDEGALDDVNKVNLFLAEMTKRQGLIAEEDAKIAKIKADNQAKIDKVLPEAKQLAREAYEKEMGSDVPTLLGNRRTGGPILQTGLYKLHANELVMDNHAVQVLDSAVKTGLILTNLQRQKLDSGSGAQNIIIQDNSVRSSNQSQPMILPPSPIEPGNSQSPGLLN